MSLAFLSSAATAGYLIYRAATNRITFIEYWIDWAIYSLGTVLYAYGWKDLLNNVDVKAVMKLTIIGQIFSCALFVLQFLFLVSYILWGGISF